jgi:hypothetical protein
MRNRVEILGEISIYRVGVAFAESFMDFSDRIRSAPSRSVAKRAGIEIRFSR